MAMLFRMSEHSSDPSGGGRMPGGTITRKAHPIFNNQKTDPLNKVTGDGGIWSLFTCNINLNNRDPRFRPPICSLIIGLVVTATGIVVITQRSDQLARVCGSIVTSIGISILLVSVAWLFLARKKVLKALAIARKSVNLNPICPEHGVRDSCKPKVRPSVDPIMTRGLISIQYRSCEDTIPPGSRKGAYGTKAVHVPQKDNFVPVESTCFQLISTPGDRNRTSGKTLSSIHKPPKYPGSVRSSRGSRLFEDRYRADNEFAVDSLVEPGRNLPFQNHRRLSSGQLVRTNSSKKRPLIAAVNSRRENTIPRYVLRDNRDVGTNFSHHGDVKTQISEHHCERSRDDNDISHYDGAKRYNPFRVAEECDRLLR